MSPPQAHATALSMTPETRELFARRHAGAATSEDLIDWAVSLLEAGVSSKSVAILAGLTTLYTGEIENYFRRSLKELGWREPGREESLRWYARRTAEKILGGEIGPREGCGTIYGILGACDHPGALARWSCLHLGHDPEPPCEDLDGADYDAAVRREARLLVTENDADD